MDNNLLQRNLTRTANLYLSLVSGRDVRNRPARFLAHRLLWRIQQEIKAGQNSTVKYHLRLQVVTGNDVTEGTEGCWDNVLAGIPKTAKWRVGD